MCGNITVVLLCLFLCCAMASPARGGGNQLSVDITGRVPSPVPGLVTAKVVPLRWDTRCLPVQFRVNDTVDPIPNPLGPSVLTVAQAIPVLQQSLDVWNDIPTSFIDMRIVGTTGNLGDAGLDMANEVTFRTSMIDPGTIALSTSFHLIEDTVLVDGDDLDGDGNPDVSSAISVCTEVGGHIKIPAGFYKAGTILDNDVIFFSHAWRLTVGPPDTDPDSADLMAIAVHEFGHSHGLAHNLTNQLSATDGRAAVMFPIFDPTDPQSELNQRTLTTDEITWSSFTYPEGSARSGPAALGPGDVAFDEVFGQITGEVRHGILKQEIIGANVFAVAKDQHGVDTIVSSGFSGTIEFYVDLLAETLEFVESLDGKYVIPVPRGEFRVGIEPLDDFPAFGSTFNLTTEFGPLFGGHDFNEEFVGRRRRIRVVKVEPGETVKRIDIVTSRSINIDNFGILDSVGFTNAAPGSYYAVQIPAAQIMAAVRPGHDLLIESADFVTFPADSSVVPVFAEAVLTTGTINPDGTALVDLATPLERVTDFVGQDTDFARLMFEHPGRLGATVRRGIKTGEIENLFVVLRVPMTTPFPGISGLPPLIGQSETDVPIFGLSYFSNDGGVTFRQRTDTNFMFRLVLSR